MRIVEYPAIPYETSIHNGFNQGATIEIHGAPFQGRSQLFTINLRSREGIALHFTVRMGHNGEFVVVLNNERYSKWQSEQRITNPFRNGQKFKLQLINMTNSFTFYLNGSPLTHFHHRESPHNITSLEISGDITIERLIMDKFSDGFKTPSVDVHTDVLSVSLAQTHITSTIPGQPYPAGTVYPNNRGGFDPNKQRNTHPASFNPHQGQFNQYQPQQPPPPPTYSPYQNQGPQPSYEHQYHQQNSYGPPSSYQTEPSVMVRAPSPTRVYVQEQPQERMVIEHQYAIQREAPPTNVYVQNQTHGGQVTVQSEGPTSVFYEQEQSRIYQSSQMGPPPIGVTMPSGPSVYMSQAQSTQVYDQRQQESWAYTSTQTQPQVVVRQPAPVPVVVEQVPPPLYVRQQAPPPVVIRPRAPSPVIIERQAPTTVVYTERPPSPRIVVTTQKPCKTAIVAEGVHTLVDAIAEAVHNSKKRCN